MPGQWNDFCIFPQGNPSPAADSSVWNGGGGAQAGVDEDSEPSKQNADGGGDIISSVLLHFFWILLPVKSSTEHSQTKRQFNKPVLNSEGICVFLHQYNTTQ